MTVETVETVVAAAPYAALIGHKLRPLLSDSQSALADCEEDVIQICHLLSRNGKLSLVRLTKSFPTIPNLRGIANANQTDERFKMWSVMLLCTIPLSVQHYLSQLTECAAYYAWPWSVQYNAYHWFYSFCRAAGKSGSAYPCDYADRSWSQTTWKYSCQYTFVCREFPRILGRREREP